MLVNGSLPRSPQFSASPDRVHQFGPARRQPGREGLGLPDRRRHCRGVRPRRGAVLRIDVRHPRDAIVFFSQETLETAVYNAAREIRTGQAQQQGFSAVAFKGEICKQLMSLFDCTNGLSLNARTYPTFASINLVTPTDANGNFDPSKFTYDPGHGTDIVVVRAFYEWPLISNWIGTDLSNMADGSHMLATAAVFRNEPFPW